MASTLSLSLTDELRAFVDESCGVGTRYATPSDFVRDLLRQERMRQAAVVRDAILEGYEDAVAGRVVEYDENLEEILERAKRCH